MREGAIYFPIAPSSFSNILCDLIAAYRVSFGIVF